MARNPASGKAVTPPPPPPKPVCSRCLKPKSEHKWKEDGEDWMLVSDGAVTVENENGMVIYCPAFTAGDPLVGVELLVVAVQELNATLDLMAELIERVEPTLTTTMFPSGCGLLDMLNHVRAIRARAQNEALEVDRIQHIEPDITSKVAEQIATTVSWHIVGKDDEDASYHCAKLVLTQVHRHMHWCLAKDNETIGGALVALHIVQTKLDKLFGR